MELATVANLSIDCWNLHEVDQKTTMLSPLRHVQWMSFELVFRL